MKTKSERESTESKRDVEAREETSATPVLSGPVAGRLVGLSTTGAPLVTFPGMPEIATLLARSCVALTKSDIGKTLLVSFEQGDIQRPIVCGLVNASPTDEWKAQATRAIELDGEQIVVTAKGSLTLKCGASSITLTQDGTILIRGTYVQSRSSGVNRIQGGSVRIN